MTCRQQVKGLGGDNDLPVRPKPSAARTQVPCGSLTTHNRAENDTQRTPPTHKSDAHTYGTLEGRKDEVGTQRRGS